MGCLSREAQAHLTPAKRQGTKSAEKGREACSHRSRLLSFVKTAHTVDMREMLMIIFKTVTVFLTLLLCMRVLGKRQLGELELSELVVSILAADLAAVPLQAPELPLRYGLVPVATLFLCELAFSLLTLKSPAARRWLCGKPCFLIREGKICQREMRRCRFTVDELTEELRGKNVSDPATVRYAVLETDGTLNVVLYPEHRPVTAGQLQIAAEDEGYPIVLIEDGMVKEENLRAAGRDERWLHAELLRRGCSAGQVYVMILFGSGAVYLAKKDPTGKKR